MNEKTCQSCGMSMSGEDMFGKNSNGSKNEDYCCYCYPNGDFSKDETMEEMIETCIPFMIEDGICKDRESAKAMLMSILPNLKRWKN